MDKTAETVSETTEQSSATINVAGASPEIVTDNLTDDLKIVLGEFEGPLDLLLHLIARRGKTSSEHDQPEQHRRTHERHLSLGAAQHNEGEYEKRGGVYGCMQSASAFGAIAHMHAFSSGCMQIPPLLPTG